MNLLLLRYLPEPMKKVVGIAIAGAATLAAARLAKLMRHAPGSVMPQPRTGPAEPPPAPTEAPPAAPAAPAASPAADLAKASKEELYQRAQELGIKGRSKMSKAELVAALENSQRP